MHFVSRTANRKWSTMHCIG